MEKRRDEDGRLVGQGRGRGLSVFLPGLLYLLAVIITKQEQQQHGIGLERTPIWRTLFGLVATRGRRFGPYIT
jgi:hypothetical protein